MITNYSRYTVKLCEIMKSDDGMARLNKALSTYPLYEAKKVYDLIPTREQLNEKLLNHYKYHEIGFETVGRFVDELEITMKEIMPMYNEWLKTVEIMADLENPFDNVDVTETVHEERTEKGTSSGTSTSEQAGTSTNEGTESHTGNTTTSNNSSNTQETKVSDTPQNNVDNVDNYLSEYRKQTDTATGQGSENTTSSGTNKNTTTDSSNGTASSSAESNTISTFDHTYTKKGNQGVNTYAHDMNEFRTSIVDVVDKIINDKRIAELFMLVW